MSSLLLNLLSEINRIDCGSYRINVPVLNEYTNPFIAIHDGKQLQASLLIQKRKNQLENLNSTIISERKSG
jgi:hypothetical protein